jgi:hypothetical protein
MIQRVRAVYRRGTLVPSSPLSLPEDSEVELSLEGPLSFPPSVTDPKERSRILAELVDRMRNNPIPADSPRVSRESIHERR